MRASNCSTQEYNCSTDHPPSTWHPDDEHIVTMIISFLGLPGNVIVIILIFRAKQKRSTMTCLLLSLAIADIVNLLEVNGVSFLILLVDESRKYRWRPLLYTIPPKVAANLTLVMIALGRYNAIVKTMKSFMSVTRRKIVIGVAASWLIGLTLTTLIVLHDNSHPTNSRQSPSRSPTLDHNRTLNANWSRPDSDGTRYDGKTYYWSFLVLLCYIIPLLVVVFCYASILKGLYIDGTVLGEKVVDKTHLNEKKRLVHCLLVITFVFVVCNVPAIIIMVLKHVFDMVESIKAFYQALLVLSCTSSLLNPFIYALHSENYRNQIKQLFCKSQGNENVIVRLPLSVAYHDTKLQRKSEVY